LLVELARAMPQTRWPTVAISIASVLLLLAFQFLLPRVLARWRTFPAALAQSLSKSGPIIVVIVGTAIVAAFHLGSRHGVSIIGEIPSGLPRFALPALAVSEFLPLIPLAFTISFIGFLENISVAKSLAAKRQQKVDSNQEFIALGAANLAAGVTGGYPPFTVLERSGVRVGVIGIAATIIDKTMHEHFSTGLRFTLGNEELPGHIQRLREKERVDVVVVLSHLGFPHDVKLAAEVAGIDVLLSGHTHNRMDRPLIVNGATIIQSGCHGSFVGRLDLELNEGKVALLRHELISVDDSIPEDAAMQRVVGHTETALNRNTMLEATMDNLLLQTIAEAAGTSIAFSNGWRYGAPIPVGSVTVNDLWNIVPPNPPISTVELTGRRCGTCWRKIWNAHLRPTPINRWAARAVQVDSWPFQALFLA
jgi:hypothetical protein